MVHSLTILAAALAAIGPVFEPKVLRDIPSARLYRAAPFERHVLFDLTGGVEYVDREKRWFILSDGTNRVSLTSRIVTPKVKCGDRIRVRGCSERENAYEHRLECKEVEIVGTAPLPPVRDITIAQTRDASSENVIVRLCGTVTDVCRDEIDRHYRLLTLSADSQSALVALKAPDLPLSALNAYLGAAVCVTGLCTPDAGVRRYSPAVIGIDSTNEITVLKVPPMDPFDLPALAFERKALEPTDNAARRRIDGTVLATWRGNRLILDDGRHHAILAELAPGEVLPAPGTDVTLVGFPSTDFFHVNLMAALCRPTGRTNPVLAEEPLSLATIRTDASQPQLIHPGAHGQLVRLRGKVDYVSHETDPDTRMRLVCDGLVIDAYASSVPSSLIGVTPGCTVEVDGICVLEGQNWSPERRLFPRIENYAIILRRPSDVRLLARPPWWTAERLALVILTLSVLLVAVWLWNRWLRRLIDRRGRDLAHEHFRRKALALKVDERTRLSIELHDTLSQNLSGVSYQLSSATESDDARERTRALETAARMLDSCRTELRYCLSDLREKMLEETDFESAIRRTLQQVRGSAEITVRFNVRTARLPDHTVHAILCIIRELTANAIRHGRARNIRIAGNRDGDSILFSVRDDGRGFDPAHRPSMAEGHFGLDGVNDRVNRLHGSWTVESAPGAGTYVKVRVRIRPDADEHGPIG